MSDDKRQRIEYIKREIFCLDMKDNWDYVDFKEMDRLKDELRKLEEEVHD